MGLSYQIEKLDTEQDWFGEWIEFGPSISGTGLLFETVDTELELGKSAFYHLRYAK